MPITLSGEVVDGGTGLATHPLTGQLWAILKLQGQSGRELVTIDPSTGVATSIGDTGHRFAAIAFGGDGTLYGVTGDGGTPPETLFVINTSDASSTSILTLGNGSDGEALAFNPLDGMLYHASGHIGDFEVIFEKINLSTLAVTDIPINGTALVDEEAQALVFWGEQGVFLWKQDHTYDAPLYRVTPDGVPTLIGNLDHQSKGWPSWGTSSFWLAMETAMKRSMPPTWWRCCWRLATATAPQRRMWEAGPTRARVPWTSTAMAR